MRQDYAYRWVPRGHPLGRPDKRTQVGEHRLTLWTHLGEPDSSACVWCGYVLPWKADGSLRCVNTDHLNGDPRRQPRREPRPGVLVVQPQSGVGTSAHR